MHELNCASVLECAVCYVLCIVICCFFLVPFFFHFSIWLDKAWANDLYVAISVNGFSIYGKNGKEERERERPAIRMEYELKGANGVSAESALC